VNAFVRERKRGTAVALMNQWLLAYKCECFSTKPCNRQARWRSGDSDVIRLSDFILVLSTVSLIFPHGANADDSKFDRLSNYSIDYNSIGNNKCYFLRCGYIFIKFYGTLMQIHNVLLNLHELLLRNFII